jgi:hypothetical protein
MNLAEYLKALEETLLPLAQWSQENTHTFAWDRAWATAYARGWLFQLNV